MPVYLVDPGGLDTAYAWEGAVFAPAQGGTYPIPAELIEAVNKLKEYIAARQPKPAENGAGTAEDLKVPGASTAGVVTASKESTGAVTANEESTGAETDSGPSPPQSLPDGFPGKSDLEAAGLSTIDNVQQRADDGTLTEISGIGRATAQQIETYLQTYGSS